MNELLGWGQLLSDATKCDRANADFMSLRTSIRCAFADANVSRVKARRSQVTQEPRN